MIVNDGMNTWKDGLCFGHYDDLGKKVLEM
jgi:hypothetical protein